MKYMIDLVLLILIAVSAVPAQPHQVIQTEVVETHSIAISDDDKMVAYGNYKKIFIIDAYTKKPIRTLEGATGDINELVFVGDCLLATGGKYFGIWDVNTGRKIAITERDEYTSRLSVCRKTNIAYTGRSFIEGWNIKDGSSVMKTEKFSDEVESFAISPDGRLLYVSPKWGNSILVLDAKTGKQIDALNTISRANQMLFHPDGKSLFISQFAKKIKQVNLKGEILQEIGESMPSYGQISISGNGEYLLLPTWSSLRDIEQVIVYDIKGRKIFAELNVSENSISEAKITSDNKIIVAAPKDNKLHFLELEN